MLEGLLQQQQSGVAPSQGFDWSGNSKLWPALVSAGFGMMASRSPHIGTAIGEGGIAGVSAYNAALQREQDNKKQALDNALKFITAQQAEERLAQSGQMTDYQKAQLARSEPPPVIKGPDGKPTINPLYIDLKKKEAEITQKDNWKVIQGDGITTPDRLYNSASGEFKDVPPGTGQAALQQARQAPSAAGQVTQPPAQQPAQQAQAAASGQTTQQPTQQPLEQGYQPDGSYDYRVGAPHVEKGGVVPEPPALVGHAPDLLKRDANYWVETGVLPKGSVSPRNKAGIEQMNYVRAVQNYGVALAASRGLNMAQMADIQRFGSQAAKFPLSRQGDQTVALGTAIRHLDSLRQYALAWDEAKGNINSPVLRQAAAMFAKTWGSAAPTNLEQATRISAPEIIKAIGVAGAGTGGERFAQEEGFQPGASTPQILGAIHVAQDYLAGQLPAKEAQARSIGFPHDRFIDMVGGHEYDYLTAIRGGKGGEGGEKTTPARKLSGGVYYIRGPNGEAVRDPNQNP
jgi:hypothetical protein